MDSELNLDSLTLQDKEIKINDFTETAELELLPIVETVKQRKTLTHKDFKSRHSMKKASADLQEPEFDMDFKKPKQVIIVEKESIFSCFASCFGGNQVLDRANTMPSVSRSATAMSISGMTNILPPQDEKHKGKKLLVLDLDETLVHSSFKPVADADIHLQLDLGNKIVKLNVLLRPGLDLFLSTLSKYYEIAVFTASVSLYANSVIDKIDTHKVVKHRLFREHCVHHKGIYVKDLGLLGRALKDVIIVDNLHTCYLFHPANAIPITSWYDDRQDTELLSLIPFLESLKDVDDVTTVLDQRTIEF
ncbi:hypothetical protein HDV01_005519 [Terramyces sp. JEL0728]|nr:hypothetical protein HDV01_005519 [Terramyces sp. JEL0728]